MIKLSRGECPEELTEEVCQELTRLYSENKEKDVWNSPKIKKPLKEALLAMSHSKCSYCECKIDIESKDVTIDHFLPKSLHPELVVEWENLFPTCLRCNREKNDCDEILLNPCENEPKEFLALSRQNPFRLKGIDSQGVGKKTILAIGLNNPDRVMVERLSQWEDIHQKLEEIYEDLQDYGYQEKYRNRLKKLLNKCTVSNAYSAVKASNILVDEYYINIRQIIINNGRWDNAMIELEEDIKQIAFRFV